MEPKNEQEIAPEGIPAGKKAYAKPVIQVYGRLAEITRNKGKTSTAKPDGGPGNVNTH
jgi:hypothetical protein